MASLAHDELSALSLGMHRICCNNRASKVEWLEQWSKSEDLVRLVIFYVALTNHHSGIVTKRAKQLDLGALFGQLMEVNPHKKTYTLGR